MATLRRKVTKFALMPAMPGPEGAAQPAAGTATDANILEDAYRALVSVGHGPSEARDRLDKVLAKGKSFQESVEEVLLAIYQNQG